MNDKQKICLWVGIALIVVMGLFPPWVCETDSYFGRGSRLLHHITTEPGPYSLIVDPPARAKFVDLYRLGIQYFVVAVLTAGLIITLRDKKGSKKDTEPSGITMKKKTKKCPFCAEEIQAESIKCHFCGENLETCL